MAAPDTTILALDVGQVRIGLALARLDTRLASPLITLANDQTFFQELQRIIDDHQVSELVIGYPRNLAAEATAQTVYVEQFVDRLKQYVALPLTLQDEALTSVKAEQELQARDRPYAKADIDSLSATYILEDFLQQTAVNRG